MKCSEVRRIINLLMDGEQHPQAEEARAHVSQCAACMEWQASMDRAISLISAEELPDIDLSAAIMSRLPERHPASQPRRWRITRRTLAWIAACWAAGLLAFLAIGFVLTGWLTPGRTETLVVGTYDFVRGFMGVLGHILAVGMVVLEAVVRIFGDHDVTSYGLTFVLLDSIILAAIAFIWLRRKRAHGLFMVVS